MLNGRNAKRTRVSLSLMAGLTAALMPTIASIGKFRTEPYKGRVILKSSDDFAVFNHITQGDICRKVAIGKISLPESK